MITLSFLICIAPFFLLIMAGGDGDLINRDTVMAGPVQSVNLSYQYILPFKLDVTLMFCQRLRQ